MQVVIRVSKNEMRDWKPAAKKAGLSLPSWLLLPRREERKG